YIYHLDVCHLDVCNLRYYPQGGGEVILNVDPLVEQALKPLSMINRGNIINIKGRVTIANFPEEVATKIISGVSQVFSNERLPELKNIKPDIEINIEKIASGKGQSPVNTGKIAAERLLNNIKHGGCVDEYLQDQLIIFMAIAEGKSQIVTGPVTQHTRTAIHFAEVMSGAKFNIEEYDKRPDDKRPDDKRPDDKRPDDKRPDDKCPDDKRPDDKRPDDKYTV
ncbi:559_t:CDS:2, partial [Racocetra persica]